MSWGKVNLAVRLLSINNDMCKVLVVSLSDDAISFNGKSQVPTAVNSDGPSTACYATTFIVKTNGNPVNYVVTNGTASVSGKIPAFDFNRIVLCSCDDLAGISKSMAYSYARHLYQSGQKPLMIMLDDIVYSDRNGANIDDTGYTGLVGTGQGQSTNLQFDYTLPVMAQLGLLGNPSSVYIRQGHDPDRQWCYRNIPTIVAQAGDHPFGDDCGWAVEAQTASYWTSAVTVWDKLYGSGMLPRLSGQTDFTNHDEAMDSQLVIDGVQFLFIDRVTKGEGGGATGTVEYGNSQIDRILAAAAADSSKIKVLCMPNTVRYLDVSATSPDSGANEPKYNTRLAEYQRLITAASTGLQALAASQGFVFIMCTGDHHNPQVLQHENTSGAVNESYNQIVVGSGFGSQNHNVNSDFTGVVYDGTTCLYAENRSSSDYKATLLDLEIVKANSSWSGKLEVHGKLIDGAFQTKWRGMWHADQTGNLAMKAKKKIGVGSV